MEPRFGTSYRLFPCRISLAQTQRHIFFWDVSEQVDLLARFCDYLNDTDRRDPSVKKLQTEFSTISTVDLKSLRSIHTSMWHRNTWPANAYVLVRMVRNEYIHFTQNWRVDAADDVDREGFLRKHGDTAEKFLVSMKSLFPSLFLDVFLFAHKYIPHVLPAGKNLS